MILFQKSLFKSVFTALFVSLLVVSSCSDSDNNQGEIDGVVMSGNQVIPGSNVSLFCSGIGSGIILLGEDVSDETGAFSISFEDPGDRKNIQVLFYQ